MDGRTDGISKAQPQANAPFDACRDKLLTHLNAVVPKMLDQVDDSLFALAEKTVNNEHQARYFEAMREVRKRRSDMESTFRLSFASNIDKKMTRNKDTQALFQLPDLNDFSLGLVNNEDLEESLAVTSMVAKIRTQCKDELFALDRRGVAQPVGHVGRSVMEPDANNRATRPDPSHQFVAPSVGKIKERDGPHWHALRRA